MSSKSQIAVASLEKFFWLEPLNARRLARFIWIFALIMYGMRIVVDLMSVLLWFDLSAAGALLPHPKFNAVTIVLSHFHSLLMTTLELFAIRLVIEICFQLLPMHSSPSDGGAKSGSLVQWPRW
jgi:hypothetical protein